MQNVYWLIVNDLSKMRGLWRDILMNLAFNKLEGKMYFYGEREI